MIPQLQREATVSAPEQTIRWSLAKRFGFRFLFCYSLVYIDSGVVGSLPSYKHANAPDASFWISIWHTVVPWVGANILHLQGDISEVANGSGDELYSYVLVVCVAAVALLAALVWSCLDRKRPNYRYLNEWLRLLMRLTVGWAMIGYGVKKLFSAQFPPPSLAKLLEPYGQASPMGLLWTFMGASPLYNFFGGIGETTGGLLLTIPRFATLGALVSFAMTLNVLMLNLGYDVPRKIYSIHLVLFCLYLLAPDLKRLADMFIFNRTVEPRTEIPLFKDKQFNKAAVAFQVFFGAYIFFIAGRQSYQDAAGAASRVPGPIRGIWQVDEFTLDGVAHAPLLTDPDRWRHVTFDSPNALDIQFMQGLQKRYLLKLDSGNSTATLYDGDKPQWKANLDIASSQPDRLTLQGQFGNHQVTANMDRVDLSDPRQFYLVNRGFHWINPAVDNR